MATLLRIHEQMIKSRSEKRIDTELHSKYYPSQIKRRNEFHARIQKRRTEIYTYLQSIAKNGKAVATCAQIANATDIHKGTTTTTLRDMKKAGMISTEHAMQSGATVFTLLGLE